jgi:hypothetical protein
MRKRGYRVGPFFGEAEDFHLLRRFRLRGFLKINIEGAMTIVGQNLKRFLKHRLAGCFSFWLEMVELIQQFFFLTFTTACVNPISVSFL